MTKLDEARNILEQYDDLVAILDKFYRDDGVTRVMYFTVEESAILAEYLINNGIVVQTVKEKTK